jgi:TetR/AcrR family transcriptional repressor of bet genes
MARPSNTEQRQAQITGALAKVMAKRGYDGASVAAVAKAARLSPGLVHYHFKNKQQILLALLRDLVARHAMELDKRLERTNGDPTAELAAFIDFHLGVGADADPQTLSNWVLLSGEALRNQAVRVEFERAVQSIIARLAAIIERGVAERVFTVTSADAAASALVATIQGYFVIAATARASIPSGSAAACAKQMAEGLLRPTRPLRDLERAP